MGLVHKVRAAILEHHLLHRGETLVVGVSGGPDSLALLHALCALAPELEIKLQVAHLNHQLRGAASDADAEFVMRTAREWGLPAASASWDVRGYAHEHRLSIEEAARVLRYQFLAGVAAQVKASAVAVAHNADDQVETVLMHFLRGAGLAGLRGMPYDTRLYILNFELRLIRPLLDVARAEVERYCLENHLQPRWDATNADTTLFRNRLRHEVIPYLEKINPNLREVIRRSALSIADDYEYIHQNVLGIFERMTRTVDDAIVFDRKWFRALPVNLQRGVLREAVWRLRHPRNINWIHIEEARRVAVEKDAGAEATLPRGLLLVVGYDDFTIGAHVPLPDQPLLHGEPIVLKVGEEVLLPDSDWGVRTSAQPTPLEGESAQPAPWPGEGVWSARFDADKIRGTLVLRPRRAGERFAPKGMGGKHKSLHEFMVDAKIPRHIRDLIPILADDEKILWVVGYRADERTKVTPQTSNVIGVEFFKSME